MLSQRTRVVLLLCCMLAASVHGGTIASKAATKAKNYMAKFSTTPNEPPAKDGVGTDDFDDLTILPGDEATGDNKAPAEAPIDGGDGSGEQTDDGEAKQSDKQEDTGAEAALAKIFVAEKEKGCAEAAEHHRVEQARVDEEVKHCRFVHQLTDIEGDYPYLVRALKELASTDSGHWEGAALTMSKVDEEIKRGDLGVRMAEGHCFVHTGDVSDHVAGTIRTTKALVDMKMANPNSVFLVLGNRDSNKLRLRAELQNLNGEIATTTAGPCGISEDTRSRIVAGEYKAFGSMGGFKGQGKKNDQPYSNWLEELLQGEESADAEKLVDNRLDWQYSGTMGARNNKEARMKEMALLSGSEWSLIDLYMSFQNDARPNHEDHHKDGHPIPHAPTYELIALSQMAVVIGDTVYGHGGIDDKILFLNPTTYQEAGKVESLKAWIRELNQWKHAEFEKFQAPNWGASVEIGVSTPGDVDGFLNYGGEPIARSALPGNLAGPSSNKHDSITTCRAQLMKVKSHEMEKPEMNGKAFNQGNPVGASTFNSFKKDGIRRAIYGHTPRSSIGEIVFTREADHELLTLLTDTSFNRACKPGIEKDACFGAGEGDVYITSVRIGPKSNEEWSTLIHGFHGIREGNIKPAEFARINFVDTDPKFGRHAEACDAAQHALCKVAPWSETEALDNKLDVYTYRVKYTHNGQTCYVAEAAQTGYGINYRTECEGNHGKHATTNQEDAAAASEPNGKDAAEKHFEKDEPPKKSSGGVLGDEVATKEVVVKQPVEVKGDLEAKTEDKNRPMFLRSL